MSMTKQVNVEGGKTPTKAAGDDTRAHSPPLSQASGATELAEAMGSVGLEDKPLSRSQRRLMNFLRTRRNIVEDEAYQVARDSRNNQSRKRKSSPAGPSRSGTSVIPDEGDTKSAAPKKSSSSDISRMASKRETGAAYSKPLMKMSDALKIRRVGIIGPAPFTLAAGNSILNAIVATVERKLSDLPPEFHGIQRQFGFLVATVADQESELWLRTYQDELIAASGCELKIVSEKDIPTRNIYKGVFTHSAEDTNARILHLLECYSRHFVLKTQSWNVVRRVDDGQTAILFIVLDEASADYIESKDGVLPFRLGHARVSPTWQSSKPTADDGVTDPAAEAGPSTPPTHPLTAKATRSEATSIAVAKATPQAGQGKSSNSKSGTQKKKTYSQPTISESVRKSERVKK